MRRFSAAQRSTWVALLWGFVGSGCFNTPALTDAGPTLEFAAGGGFVRGEEPGGGPGGGGGDVMGLPACQRTLFLSEPTVDWHLEGTPDGGAPLDASVPADGGCVHHQQTQSLREHEIDRCQGLAHAVPHDDGVQLRFDETVRLSLTNVDLAPVVTFEQPVQVDFSRRWVPACGGFCAGGTTISHLVVRDLDGGLVWAGTQDRSLTDALLTELLGPERLSLGSCGATLSNGCGSSVIEYSSIKVGSAIQVVLLAGQPQRFATASGVYEVVWSDPVVRHSVNGCGVLEGSPPGASPYFTLRKL